MKKLCLILTIMIGILLGNSCLAQELTEAGPTSLGVLYVDVSSAQSVSKEGKLYLAVAAEERYTDQEYLASLRQDEDLRDAVGAVYLYLFDNRGANYCVAAHYIVNEAGKVCVDMGSDWQLRPTVGKKALLEAYTKALQALERKRRWQQR